MQDKCPKCGNEEINAYEFRCWKCGAELKPTECSECGEKGEDTFLGGRCRNCGYTLSKKKKKSIKKGKKKGEPDDEEAPVEDAPPPQSKPPKRPFVGAQKKRPLDNSRKYVIMDADDPDYREELDEGESILLARTLGTARQGSRGVVKKYGERTRDIEDEAERVLRDRERRAVRDWRNRDNPITNILWYDIITLVVLGVVGSLIVALAVFAGGASGAYFLVVLFYFMCIFWYMTHEYRVMSNNNPGIDKRDWDEEEDEVFDRMQEEGEFASKKGF